MQTMQISGRVSGKFTYSYECVGSVEFITSGPQGGDGAGHGFLEISFDTGGGSTSLAVNVDGQSSNKVRLLRLRFEGDEELRAAADCFAFLAQKLHALKELCNMGHPQPPAGA
jgi:hypothetical protein